MCLKLGYSKSFTQYTKISILIVNWGQSKKAQYSGGSLTRSPFVRVNFAGTVVKRGNTFGLMVCPVAPLKATTGKLGNHPFPFLSYNPDCFPPEISQYTHNTTKHPQSSCLRTIPHSHLFHCCKSGIYSNHLPIFQDMMYTVNLTDI